MEDYTLFMIVTAHRPAHKWDVSEDGLIDFFGDVITPHEALERFHVEYPMFTVLRADISVRTDEPNGIYSYTWRELERLL